MSKPASISQAWKVELEREHEFIGRHLLDQGLTRLYSKQGEVLDSWTAFLGKYPDHGHAYLLRALTYAHRGQTVAAGEDGARACELGRCIPRGPRRICRTRRSSVRRSAE